MSVVSNSVRPHRRQPTRLPRPWDSPGKNTGVGRHFLLQCRKVKSESEVAQSCPTPSNPMDCSPPGPSVHGIFPGKSTGVGCHCLLRINLTNMTQKTFSRAVHLKLITSTELEHSNYISLFSRAKSVIKLITWKLCQNAD